MLLDEAPQVGCGWMDGRTDRWMDEWMKNNDILCINVASELTVNTTVTLITAIGLF